MSELGRKREQGRGERVLGGLWRLRLPLPWPGVPHCNAWAIRAGDGIVLVDTGMHEPGSLEQLERAMKMVGLRLEDVRLLVCTHAHTDHYGQAGPIIDRAGCELWMHPNYQHATGSLEDPSSRSSGASRSAARAACRSSCCAATRRSRRSRCRGSTASSTPTSRCCPGSRSRRTSARGA